MSNTLRRYEILLPLQFNDGKPVPEDFVAETLDELQKRFSAVSWETQTIRGQWESEGRTFRDDLVRVFVDVPDDAPTRRFFLAFKERVKKKFRQQEIWMTTFLVEAL